MSYVIIIIQKQQQVVRVYNYKKKKKTNAELFNIISTNKSMTLFYHYSNKMDMCVAFVALIQEMHSGSIIVPTKQQGVCNYFKYAHKVFARARPSLPQTS